MSIDITSGMIYAGSSIIFETVNIYSGGIGSETSIGLAGSMDVFDSGLADNVSAFELGHLSVHSGGLATNARIETYGHLNLRSGGTASGITLTASAIVSLELAPGTYLNAATASGSLIVSNGILSNVSMKKKTPSAC